MGRVNAQQLNSSKEHVHCDSRMYALQCLHNGMTIYSVADLLTNGIGLEVVPVKTQ